MGDVAMTVPVIRAFVDQHPTCKVTILSKPFLQPLFDDISNVNFYAANVKGKHKGIPGLYQLSKELKQLGITHIADFHNVLRSKILRKLLSTSSIPVSKIDKGRKEKKALTRENNKVFRQLKTSHQRYVDVLNSLGFPTLIDKPKTIIKQSLSDSLKNLLGEKKTSWIGIAPFAAFDGKMYPLNLMKEVITELSKEHQVLLFGGGKKEVKILDDIESTSGHIINIAGKISFKEELEVISHLDVMLSMDSGNAHLAAMQQVKTITLWGVTHPYAGFAPYNQPQDYCILSNLEKYPKIPCSIYGNTVFEGYENVMETIDPKTVVKKIKSIL